MTSRWLLCVLALGLLPNAKAVAAGTASWDMSTFADFSRGKLTGLALSRDGRITLAPKLEVLFSSDEPVLWSLAEGADKAVYAGTGHRGRVYRVEPNGKSSVTWNAPEPEVFAVATAADGTVYAGTSPSGKVYRIQDGKATEFFNPNERYIWSLAFASDGALFVATGDHGKIFRVTPEGKGELYYDTGQSHVTCLSIEKTGSLLAGSEPNGILYRVSGKDKAFVLYDSSLPEIRAIAADPDGTVYVSALGGSIAQKTGAAAGTSPTSSTTPISVPGTTITVTDEAQSPLDLRPKPGETPKVTSSILPGTTVYTAVQEVNNAVEKSAIYKINPDNTVETLWTSREENAYDLLLNGDHILFSSDNNGRIYRLLKDRRLTLLLQTNEGEATRLLSTGDRLLAATSSMGKLFRLGNELAPQGVYESPVHDAGTVARWGQLSWRGERLLGASLLFRTRSGNSARPDRTWTDWSAPMSEPSGGSITSPNTRFLQWKAELQTAPGTPSPSFASVTVNYLPQNNPPVLNSLNVTTTLTALPPSGRPATAAAASAYSVTVTDTGDAGASTVSGTAAQTIARGLAQQIQISWQADDPDGDRLSYSLYFKGEEEREWKLLRSNFAENSYTIDGDNLADGKYLFRVIASDRAVNSVGTSRQAEITSAPIIFDNTPPLVTVTASRRSGPVVEIDLQARDVSSGLRRAEYSLDATTWIPIEAVDGVTDGLNERFAIRLGTVAPGEHLLVIRVFDAANNAGLTKTVVAP